MPLISRHLSRGIDDVVHLEALGWLAINRSKSSKLLQDVCVDSRRYQRPEKRSRLADSR